MPVRATVTWNLEVFEMSDLKPGSTAVIGGSSSAVQQLRYMQHFSEQKGLDTFLGGPAPLPVRHTATYEEWK